MTKHEVSIGGSVAASGTFTADVRTSLTGQFLTAAAMQARAAGEMESKPVADVTESDKVMHRGPVVGAIMQATAALECEIWEVMIYGPGHHLGSNGIDTKAQAFLAPLADMIDSESVLGRYRCVLHLLRKAPLNCGEQPWQDAARVVRLRNESVHYKSRWGQDLDRSKLVRVLQPRRSRKPPFIPEGMNVGGREFLRSKAKEALAPVRRPFDPVAEVNRSPLYDVLPTPQNSASRCISWGKSC